MKSAGMLQATKDLRAAQDCLKHAFSQDVAKKVRKGEWFIDTQDKHAFNEKAYGELVETSSWHTLHIWDFCFLLWKVLAHVEGGGWQ